MSYFSLVAFGLFSTLVVAQVSSPVVGQSRQPSSSVSAVSAEGQGDRDPLLDLPPLPKKEVTLVGGVLVQVDRVRDQILVKPFGGRDMDIAFDLRTRILRDQDAITARDLRPGSRVYVDTLFDGSRVFAKTIQVRSQSNCGDARGQVVGYDHSRGLLELREEMVATPLSIKVTPQTSIRRNEHSAAASDIPVGALVAVSFASGADGRPAACDIHVLAVPGQAVTFYGTITFLDLSSRRIAINNRSDETKYDISLGSISQAGANGVREGMTATITAIFDGQHYVAKAIETYKPVTGNQP